ncbi:MAG: membrane protein insertase YidC [Desulfobacterales bacterium]|nr:membrane protein insertase YidC [Desulfobacterales bacterium]
MSRENLRLVFAIVLSFCIFILFDAFFVKKEPPKQAVESGETTLDPSKTTTTSVPEQSQASIPSVAASQDALAEDAMSSGREITVENQFYIAKFSERSGSIRSFALKQYRESISKDAPLKELIAAENVSGTILSDFSSGSEGRFEHPLFTANSYESMQINDGSQSLIFTSNPVQGLVFEKKFTFDSDKYLIGMELIIKNVSDVPVSGELAISLARSYLTTSQYGFEGPSGWINKKLEQVEIKDIKESEAISGDIQWVGLEDRYFISSVISKTPGPSSMKTEKTRHDIVYNRLIQAVEEIPAGGRQQYSYFVFMGPKSTQLLSKVGYDLKNAIDFGWFDIIAKPCLWLMNWLYGFIPNYGIAIIILTLITKVILWPLGTKSYRSMNDMKRLQPLMAEIREKHKNDRPRMNQEIMLLYRTYKVNPVGGCLPMVFQIPVFFALYRMLYSAIELRHAPFFGWITDLSAPDRLFNFGFSIPFMEPPYGIPVLTIVMGATMFLQQKMSPAPGDPAQAKMMMFMPIVFTFIFINFSSGLVLYWLVNNIFSISQQFYISKKFA